MTADLSCAGLLDTLGVNLPLHPLPVGGAGATGVECARVTPTLRPPPALALGAAGH